MFSHLFNNHPMCSTRISLAVFRQLATHTHTHHARTPTTSRAWLCCESSKQRQVAATSLQYQIKHYLHNPSKVIDQQQLIEHRDDHDHDHYDRHYDRHYEQRPGMHKYFSRAREWSCIASRRVATSGRQLFGSLFSILVAPILVLPLVLSSSAASRHVGQQLLKHPPDYAASKGQQPVHSQYSPTPCTRYGIQVELWQRCTDACPNILSSGQFPRSFLHFISFSWKCVCRLLLVHLSVSHVCSFGVLFVSCVYLFVRFFLLLFIFNKYLTFV